MKFTINKNPDKAAFDEVSEIIKNNDNYCCCTVAKNEDTLCMCKEFREQKEGGFCHCSRYYKVAVYPTIAILHAPEDEDHAIALATSLTAEGFIVLLPFYHDSLHYTKHHSSYVELQKTKISKSELVFVVNSSEEAMSFLEEQIYWAEELQKKIIYEHNEEVKEDED